MNFDSGEQIANYMEMDGSGLKGKSARIEEFIGDYISREIHPP